MPDDAVHDLAAEEPVTDAGSGGGAAARFMAEILGALAGVVPFVDTRACAANLRCNYALGGPS